MSTCYSLYISWIYFLCLSPNRDFSKCWTPQESPEESYGVQKAGSWKDPQTQRTLEYQVERQHFHRNESRKVFSTIYRTCGRAWKSGPWTREQIRLHRPDKMSNGTVMHAMETPSGIAIESALLRWRWWGQNASHMRREIRRQLLQSHL